MNKYKELWDLIEKYDKEHYYNNTPYQIKETKKIVKILESFHYNVQQKIKDLEWHRELNKLIDRAITQDYYLDDLEMNVLKDRVHHLADEVRRKYERDEREYNRKEYTKFEKENYYDLVEGKDKKGHDKTQDNREYFMMDFLRTIKNEVMEECLNLYLHDEAQQKRHTRMMIENIQDVIQAHAKKVISDKQYKSFIDRSLNLIYLSLLSDKSSWDKEKEEEMLYQEYYLIRYKLDLAKGKSVYKNNGVYWTEEEIKNSIQCGEINCHETIKLTKKEKEDLENGIGVEKHYCQEHIEYGEFGGSNKNETIEWYTKKLPEVPVMIRWLGLAVDDNDEKIYDRFQEFLKSHEGIKLIEERNEKFKYARNALYLKFTDKKTLKDFQIAFKNDFSVYCSSPEILKGFKVPEIKIKFNKKEGEKNE